MIILDYSKVYNDLTKSINQLSIFNQRNSQRKINEFILSFEENMNVLISLANLSEQKSLFEVEKIKDKVLDLLNIENIDPKIKFDIITQKLEHLTKLLNNIFSNIKGKVKDYEKLAESKIVRAKESFYDNYKKFLK